MMIISEQQYKLCAVTCLFIAAKSFEIEEFVPKSSDLIRLMNKCTINDNTISQNNVDCSDNKVTEVDNSSPLIPDCERQVLNTLDWDFESEPTFNSILENFLCMGILLEDDKIISAN